MSFAQHPVMGTRSSIKVFGNQFTRSEAKLPTASGLLSSSHFPGRERSEHPAVGWNWGQVAPGDSILI